jgi:hypothetical protein
VSVEAALPVYHHRSRHSVLVASTPERALAAAREVRLVDVRVVRILFRLRGLRAAHERTIWRSMLARGFRLLDDETLGAVGRPWSPKARLRDVADFTAFTEPGWAKLALGFHASPASGGSRLETETRVYLTDAASRRRFACYWLVVRPFSGAVRRSWLAAARRRAELYP